MNIGENVLKHFAAFVVGCEGCHIEMVLPRMTGRQASLKLVACNWLMDTRGVWYCPPCQYEYAELIEARASALP